MFVCAENLSSRCSGPRANAISNIWNAIDFEMDRVYFVKLVMDHLRSQQGVEAIGQPIEPHHASTVWPRVYLISSLNVYFKQSQPWGTPSTPLLILMLSMVWGCFEKLLSWTNNVLVCHFDSRDSSHRAFPAVLRSFLCASLILEFRTHLSWGDLITKSFFHS